MRLVLATDAQKLDRDHLTAAAWGQRLTLAQYLERERRLRAHRWARENMATWLLVGEGDAVLASCETFRMRSRLRRDGVERWGACHGVASVFTEPALRGRGLCSRMMGLLVERLRQDDPSALASILFSDVGVELYARSGGYRPLPAIDRVLPAAPGPASVDALCFEADLDVELAAVALPEDEYLVWPTAAQLDWHLEREREYAALLGRRRPEACGARVGNARIFWAGDLKNDQLVVLLLEAADADAAGRLLAAAQQVAHAAGLARVVVWDGPAGFDWAEVPAARAMAREGALPMLRPLEASVRPEALQRVPRALWI